VSRLTELRPSLAESWARGEREEFGSALGRGIRASAFVVLPAAAGYLVLARPIVRLLLEHGVAGRESSTLVSDVLVFFALGLLSFSAFMLFLRAFYAMEDTRTPALINVLAVGLNTGANLLLFPVLGVRGLALGHAIAYTFAAAASGMVLRGRLQGLDGRRVAAGMTRIALAAGATGISAWGAARASAGLFGSGTLTGQAAQLGLGVVAGLVTFAVAALALRIEEFGLVKGMLLGRFRR
jgi:putative peptidoglycan lipid II flippase